MFIPTQQLAGPGRLGKAGSRALADLFHAGLVAAIVVTVHSLPRVTLPASTESISIHVVVVHGALMKTVFLWISEVDTGLKTVRMKVQAFAE